MVRSEGLSTALNAETGETQPATEFRICPTSDEEQVAFSHHTRRYEVAFTIRERFGPCTEAGEMVTFEDAVGQEGSLAEHVAATADNGWIVGIEDGVLVGLRYERSAEP